MGNQPYLLKQKLIWTKQVFKGERTMDAIPEDDSFKSWPGRVPCLDDGLKIPRLFNFSQKSPVANGRLD